MFAASWSMPAARTAWRAARRRSPGKVWSGGCGGREPGGANPADHRPQLAVCRSSSRARSQRAMLAGDNSERPKLRLSGGRGRDQDRRPDRHLGRRRRFSARAAGRRWSQARRRRPRVEPYAELSRVEYVGSSIMVCAAALPKPPVPRLRPARQQARRSNSRRALSGGTRRPGIPTLPPGSMVSGAPAAGRDDRLAAVIAIQPMRVPGYAAVAPPSLLMAAYHWTIYRPDLLPPLGSSSIGLCRICCSALRRAWRARACCCAPRGARSRGGISSTGTFPFVWAGFTLLTARCDAASSGCCIPCSQLRLLDLRATVFRAVLTVAMFPVARASCWAAPSGR